MSIKHISSSSIEINAPVSKIWKALTTAEIAKKYFFGANIECDWKENSPIIFKGEYNGNSYLEKGILLSVKPNLQLQYTHWSNLEGNLDIPENYRVWTFNLFTNKINTKLTITEDNIPTEKQQKRSDEFWKGVLLKIKEITEY